MTATIERILLAALRLSRRTNPGVVNAYGAKRWWSLPRDDATMAVYVEKVSRKWWRFRNVPRGRQRSVLRQMLQVIHVFMSTSGALVPAEVRAGDQLDGLAVNLGCDAIDITFCE